MHQNHLPRHRSDAGASGAKGGSSQFAFAAAAAAKDSPGQQAILWKETVHLGFPGVKWKPAAGTTC